MIGDIGTTGLMTSLIGYTASSPVAEYYHLESIFLDDTGSIYFYMNGSPSIKAFMASINSAHNSITYKQLPFSVTAFLFSTKFIS